MPGTAVWDIVAIATRRQELFGIELPLVSAPGLDRERSGTSADHCAMCPHALGEVCTTNCAAAREALKDGISIT